MWIIFLIWSIGILLLFILIVVFLKYKHNYWKYLDVPHDEPKEWVIIIKDLFGKHKPNYINNTQRYEQLYTRFRGTGPFCGFHVQLEPFALILDKELVKQILIKDFSNFNDRGMYHNMKKDPLSSDLYCITGDEWKDMRLKLEPIFRPEMIKALHNSSFNKESQAHLMNAFDVALLMRPHSAITFVDVKPLIRRYVLASIARSVFGLDVSLQAHFPLDEFDNMTQVALTQRRHGNFINVMLQKHTAMGRKLGFSYTDKKAEKYFLNLITDVVQQREKMSPFMAQPDYLQLLIDIKTQESSTHVSMNTNSIGIFDENKALKEHLIRELAAHAFMFLREGLDPTTHTINCVLYELADNEIVQNRVRQEVLNVVSRCGFDLNYECVQQFQFMGKVILETIRRHPITPYITRRTLSDYIVPNYPKYLIRKDMFVVIPTHAMHNDPTIYPDPMKFNPERFSNEEIKNRDQCVWLGFGDGPRNCIGMHLAELQIKIAIARLLMEFKFTKYCTKSSINSEDGMPLQVARIHQVEGGRESKIVI